METPPQGRPPLAVRAGSEWCWEPLKPHAREDIRVVEVKWNGEEWWVKSEAIHQGPRPAWAALLVKPENVDRYALHPGPYWNTLDRFVEACVLIQPGPDPEE